MPTESQNKISNELKVFNSATIDLFDTLPKLLDLLQYRQKLCEGILTDKDTELNRACLKDTNNKIKHILHI